MTSRIVSYKVVPRAKLNFMQPPNLFTWFPQPSRAEWGDAQGGERKGEVLLLRQKPWHKQDNVVWYHPLSCAHLE